MRAFIYLLGTLAAIIGLMSCAMNPVSHRPDLVFMSEADEITLGRQMRPQILQEFGVYDDPELQEYVNEVGQRVAKNSDRPKITYTFTVLDSDELNAFATAGGFVYVFRGLLAYVNSEAELAAVLGHEIGHVAARHPVRQQSQSTLAGLGAAVVGIFTGNVGLGELTGYAGTALVTGYGRDMELEADRLGANYITRAGYRTDNMINVVRLLKNQETFEVAQARREGRQAKVYHGVMSTHPDNDTRLHEVVEAAGKVAGNNENADDKREPFLHHIDGLAVGSSRAQGVVRAARFYHAGMGFTIAFPTGWVVQNLPDKLIAIAPAKDSLIQMQAMAPPPNTGPRELLGRIFAQAGVSRGEELEINGLKAYTALTRTITTQFGQGPARVTVIYFNNLAYVFAGTSKASSGAPNADPVIVSSIKTFRRMKENEFALGEPRKIILVRGAPGTTVEDLAKTAAIEKYPADTLRLLNNLYPDKEPQPGQLIKSVKE